MEVVRSELAFAYKIFSHLGWDDATYTHLSARVPGKDTFLIQPFGLMYHEVTPDNLIEIDFDGEVVDEVDAGYNSTGYVIHASIYKKRPDLNAIFHLHTIAGVTVSTMECGLVPISQFSFHFYNKVSYHDYNSLSLDFHNQGTDLVNSMGINNTMILRNHGTITSGKTIHEAFLYMYFLEKACQVQINTNLELCIVPPTEVLEQTVKDLREFEPNFGIRDWNAWKRTLNFVPPVEEFLQDAPHFDNLKPPLAPNNLEVKHYKDRISGKSLLLGYTKELRHLTDYSMDLNPPDTFDTNKSHFIKGDWYSINKQYDTIIGDGILNLVGGSLVKHLSFFCKTLIIRFFTKKIKGMKYATYFSHNTEMLLPNKTILTQDDCIILIWNFT